MIFKFDYQKLKPTFGKKLSSYNKPMIKEMSLKWQLVFFSIATCIISYGFNLTNFTVAIDSEPIVTAESYMALGRWGANYIRYRLFNGMILPYFTILLSLIFMSLTAVGLARIFRFDTVASYIFCALFLSFPQMAYQFIFYMQADAVALSFLLCVLAVILFNKSIQSTNKLLSAGLFILAGLFIMFAVAVYQALVFIPVVIYLALIFRNTYLETYTLKQELKKALFFSLLMLVSGIFYFISVKVLCPGMSKDGYVASYAAGSTNNRFVDFYNLWVDNLRGDMYYGDKTFIVATLLALAVLIVSFVKARKLFSIRLLLIFLLLLIPFFISFFITSGYNPPRIYVTSGIVFAFVIAHFVSGIGFSGLNFTRASIVLSALVVLINIYFITMLYVSHNKIYNHDLELARKIDNRIRAEFPDFESARDYVYFYGSVPNSELDKFRLPDSEIFAGSFFQWDGGSNGRIIPFMRYTDVATYKIVDNPGSFAKVKDSIGNMAIWPRPGSVKRFDEVVVVKLGFTKGAPLWFE